MPPLGFYSTYPDAADKAEKKCQIFIIFVAINGLRKVRILKLHQISNLKKIFMHKTDTFSQLGNNWTSVISCLLALRGEKAT